jgi:hypothetical protein
MSITTVQSSSSVHTSANYAKNAALASFQPASNPQRPLNGLGLRDKSSEAQLAPFVDLQFSPYSNSSSAIAPQETEMPDNNPLPDLIPDEVYNLLRTNDLISEKGVRDYIIRKAFKAMRQDQELKSHEALERLQAIYPYLQIDTIRKIIYRIGPAGNRKMMY